MSKQLTLSATAAILAMTAFALATSFGGNPVDQRSQMATSAPLAELAATR
ncbi:MAG: hypothetical protein AB3N06_09145 [Erythrobacter sp.]